MQTFNIQLDNLARQIDQFSRHIDSITRDADRSSDSVRTELRTAQGNVRELQAEFDRVRSELMRVGGQGQGQVQYGQQYGAPIGGQSGLFQPYGGGHVAGVGQDQLAWHVTQVVMQQIPVLISQAIRQMPMNLPNGGSQIRPPS